MLFPLKDGVTHVKYSSLMLQLFSGRINLQILFYVPLQAVINASLNGLLMSLINEWQVRWLRSYKKQLLSFLYSRSAAERYYHWIISEWLCVFHRGQWRSWLRSPSLMLAIYRDADGVMLQILWPLVSLFKTLRRIWPCSHLYLALSRCERGLWCTSLSLIPNNAKFIHSGKSKRV